MKDKIIRELTKSIVRAYPEAEHYKNKIMEGFSPPAFLYRTIFCSRVLQNEMTEEIRLRIEVVCFLPTDRYGTEIPEEQERAYELLAPVFGRHCIAVENRMFHFTVEEEQDDHLSYILAFRFYDDAPFTIASQREEEPIAERMSFRKEEA